MDNNFHDLVLAVEESFTKKHLTSGYLPIIRLMLKNKDLEDLDPKVKQIIEKKNANKQDLVYLVSTILSQKELFKKFYILISEDSARLFKVLVWEDSFLHEEMLRREFGIEIIERREGTGWAQKSEIKNDFYIFSHSNYYNWNSGYEYLVGFPSSLRRHLVQYFKKPEGYYLEPVPEIPGNLRHFNGEEAIFQELPRILAYASQDNIKLTSSGIPVASTYNKMRKNLSLQEFFEGHSKPFDTLRTSLLATLVSDSGIRAATQAPMATLEQIFSFFSERFYPLHLLQHLKGLNYLGPGDKKRIGKVLLEILKEFPEEGGWVSMQNIAKFSRYRSLYLQVAEDYPLGRYVYYPVDNGRYTEKKFVANANYYRLVTAPLLKAGFFLFAAFGLIEVAYESSLSQEDNEAIITPYDSLQYVRLTALGAYISGKTKEYRPPETEEKASLQLLDDSLNILSDKPSQTVDMLLDNYTEKVGSSRYKTDFGIFMKGIKTAGELESKISLFQETVSEELPANWKAFFNTLRLKCDPLKSIGEHVAYQLSQEDQEMIKLVAKDPVLKKLVLKAEGFIILVMKKDLTKFKNRLKEFGYLLE